jgi:BASS family bile acid:Na+ symporter
MLVTISRLALLTFLLTSMFGVGLSLTLRQIVEPLRSLKLVTAAILGNFVFVPLLAVGTAKVFRLNEPFAIGLLLLGVAPGAPFLPKLVELAKGDLALSVGLMALLMAGTVVVLPVALPLLSAGVEVSNWQIARPLLLLMVLPLSCGLLLRAYHEGWAARLRPGLGWASNVSLVIVTVLIVTLNLPSVLKVFGTGAIGAGILFTALAGLIGHVFGGPTIATRKVMVLATGLRNIAAALVVGEEDFRDPQVLVMLVVAALAGILLLIPVMLVWRKPAKEPAVLAR